MNLEHHTVILGISASIAAYKMADVASALAKQHCSVHVIMTPNATEIIRPMTFSTLTGNNCITDTFDKTVQYNVAHVALAKKAELLFIAPATANIIAKLAHGLADDMLTTTALACTCPKYIAPAMNTAMYNNPVVQDNLQILRQYGWHVIAPDSGILACKDVGAGKLPQPEDLLDYIYREIACPKDLQNKKVLVTAGPTCEAIDPVRYITNHSSGKMGYALAYDAMLRGAEVTLVSGPTHLKPVPFVHFVPVQSAEDMAKAVLSAAPDQDIIIKAAAVADYTPKTTAPEKIKKQKGVPNIELKRSLDILKALGESRTKSQFICGFSMETENLIENSRKKLLKKKIDMIVANDLRVSGAGFQGDTNVVTLITKSREQTLPLLSKSETAHCIFDTILDLMSDDSSGLQ
ncbi:MAG: bifunctional phosphopantothenoylcysteine decarboxylase/phosphopantothenate--cysteine ligase CoaBC [Pseudoramibacter sp.]